MNGAVKPRKANGWNKRIDELLTGHPLRYKQTDSVIKPQYVVEQIYEATKGDAIITTEVGQNQMWAALYYSYDTPRRFISSGGLGTMGYGLPAAIGAKLGRPDLTVIDIAGDGSIQMNIQELTTAVSHGIPVKIAILNNRYLGMVRQWQELFFNRRYSATCIDCQPDFVKLAEAYGATGLRAEKPSEVRGVIDQALATDGTVMMDFIVDREENVWPMVAPGAAISECMEGEAQ